MSAPEIPAYSDALDAIETALSEEVADLQARVEAPDASCPARALRAERMDALRSVLRLVDRLRDWEWM